MSWVCFVTGFGHSRHVLSRFVSMRSRVHSATPRALLSKCVVFFVVARSSCFISCVHSCYVLCCVARSLCFSWAACFHVVMSCVKTSLMSILISCVSMSCFAHGWWFVLLATCLCFYFVWAHGFVLVFYVPCALMSICLNPTHLVSWLLVNLPHLSFLVSLLICSLYNLLVFAVLCQFVIVSTLVVSCLALPCLALPCLALPCLALPCQAKPSLVVSCPVFPLRGGFCCCFHFY